MNNSPPARIDQTPEMRGSILTGLQSLTLSERLALYNHKRARVAARKEIHDGKRQSKN